jgi:hypothetical protein
MLSCSKPLAGSAEVTMGAVVHTANWCDVSTAGPSPQFALVRRVAHIGRNQTLVPSCTSLPMPGRVAPSARMVFIVLIHTKHVSSLLQLGGLP